jgi:hypothetical protein
MDAVIDFESRPDINFQFRHPLREISVKTGNPMNEVVDEHEDT